MTLSLPAEAATAKGRLLAGARFIRGLSDLWCRLMHNSVMWPIHGECICRVCFHRRPVPWA